MSRSYLFLLVVLPVMAGLIWLSHRYLYRQLAVATALPATARRAVGVVLALLGLSLPVGMAVSRLAPAPWLRYWAIGSFVWMGLVLLLLPPPLMLSITSVAPATAITSVTAIVAVNVLAPLIPLLCQ